MFRNPSPGQLRQIDLMARSLALYLAMARDFGIPWLAKRAAYSVLTKAGYLEFRSPRATWADRPLMTLLRGRTEAGEQAAIRAIRTHPWFHAGTRLPTTPQSGEGMPDGFEAAANTAGFSYDGLTRGEFCFFQSQLRQVGMPIPWHLHPITRETYDREVHWSRIHDFGSGDIKWAWELGRFSFAFPLVREYRRTRNQAIPRLFWAIFRDWRASNPPNHGVHWKCGQEVALRLIAITFALRGFLSADATTDSVVAEVTQFVALSAERIEANIAYALQQKNNHGISEAAGLWTAAVLFPFLRRAAHWKQLSQKLLTDQALELIYPCGSCSQHSMNYLRLILHVYTWCLGIGAAVDMTPFLCGPKETVARSRLRAAKCFIESALDRHTGHAVRFGANDSALLFQLTDLHAGDFRPALQSLAAAMKDPLPFPPGPWDDERMWLAGDGSTSELPVARHVDRPELQSTESGRNDGLVTIRDASGFVALRVQRKFVHRPSQADLLHLDLFWRGQNVAIDPGTYTYNANPPWNMPFCKTCYHNTVMVDDADQMSRFSRFIWSHWPEGSLRFDRNEDLETVSVHASHTGYNRYPYRAHHSRSVFHLKDGVWAIYDQLQAASLRQFRLHWLFADFPFDLHRSGLVLRTPRGDYFADVRASGRMTDATVVRASENSPRGWYAPHYGSREPAVSVAWCVEGKRVDFLTVLAPVEENVSEVVQGSPVQRFTSSLRFSDTIRYADDAV